RPQPGGRCRTRARRSILPARLSDNHYGPAPIRSERALPCQNPACSHGARSLLRLPSPTSTAINPVTVRPAAPRQAAASTVLNSRHSWLLHQRFAVALLERLKSLLEARQG